MKRSATAPFFALFFALLPACTQEDLGPFALSEQAENGNASSDALTSAAAESYYVVLTGPSAVKAIAHGTDARSQGAADSVRARLAEIDAEQAALEPLVTELGATVVTHLSRLANALQVLADEPTAERLATLPGVLRVEKIPLLERSLASAVPLIRAPELWVSTPSIQGNGVTLGIIDSGIDYTHADFGGEGTPDSYTTNDPNVIEPGSFPTARVVGGWDFVGEAYNPTAGVNNAKPDGDPLDCVSILGEDISGGHGTHVAGIAAGNGVLQDGSPFNGPYEASYDPAQFRVAPGVAPAVSIYSLKVFGCQGSTTYLGAALDRAADPNKDGSFDDRLDVMNGSLGSPYGLGSVTVGEMVKELTDLGTLIVAAAGNEGQNFFVTGSPASYPEVLSVAAEIDTRLLLVSVTSPASAIQDYPGSEASFTKFLTAPVSGELVLANPVLGCEPFVNAAAMVGKIALIRRGTCPFVEKLTNAFAAGAVAGIVSDSDDSNLPFAMGGAPPGSVDIPGAMVTLAHGAELEALLSAGAVNVTFDPTLYTGPGAEVLAGFSARGPNPVDGGIKPEITAPGLIDSAAVGTGKDAVSNGGTSMASPMVAGAAVLVRQARPELSAYELKAALMNATVPLFDFSSVPYSTSRMGSGRVDVERAATSQLIAAADADAGHVGIAFGAVMAVKPTLVKRTFVLENHGTGPMNVDATIVPTFSPNGVTLAVAPENVDIAAGESFTFELSLSLDPAALGDPGPDPGTPATQGMQNPTARHYLNEASGLVHIVRTDGGKEDVTIPYEASVRSAAERHGQSVTLCGESELSPDGVLEIPMVGESAHPNPVVTAFQLGIVDELNDKSASDPITAMTDLRAVGVATDLATAPSFDEAHVFFGVAVTGDWTTPARGPVTLVSIEINNDQKGGPEYELRVEARNADRPFRDSLVTRVYDLATGEALSRYPINIVTPDLVRTYPFQNSVLVLSALLSELEVDPANPVFDWAVDTERPDFILQSEKVKGTFDAANPLVDTARHGINGSPLFVGTGPLLVDVAPGALAAGTPLDVLLLHHTNVKDRWEVVNIVPQTPGNVALTAQAPASVDEGASAEITFQIQNTGMLAALNVKVTGGVTGGELLGVVTAQGTCAKSGDLDCDLGELAPGANVTVAATVQGTTGGTTLTLKANVASDLVCEPAKADNTATASTLVIAKTPEEKPTEDMKPEKVVATGGCSCSVLGDSDTGQPWEATGALLAALGLFSTRRSRRPNGRKPCG